MTRQQSGAPEQARRGKFLALDRLSMVLLGHPTVALPDRVIRIDIRV